MLLRLLRRCLLLCLLTLSLLLSLHGELLLEQLRLGSLLLDGAEGLPVSSIKWCSRRNTPRNRRDRHESG